MLRTSPSRPWRRSISAFATLALAGAGIIATAPAMAAEPGDGDDPGECVPTPATSELAWNIHDSFLAYITGPIAAGEIEFSGGAGQEAGQAITWGEGAGRLDDSGLGTLSFSGIVHLTGHDGVLDTTFSNIRLDTEQKELIADVESQTAAGEDASVDDAVIADLNFGELAQSGGTATANLTAAGSSALSGFYEEGLEIAPVTFTHTPAVECPTEPEPVEPTTNVSVASADAESGLTLTVSGEGFVDLPESSVGSPASGVYAVLRDAKTMSDEDLNKDQGLAPAQSYITSERIVDGAWKTTLNAPAGELDRDADYEVVVWVAHGLITDDTLLATRKVTLSDAELDALFAGDGDDGDQGGEGGDDETEAPSDLSTSAKVAKATAKDGLAVIASGSGYVPDALPAPIGSDGGPGRAMGFYAAIRDANTQSFHDINENAAALAQAWIRPDQAKGGAWTTTLSVDTVDIPAGADLELLTWSAHGVLTEDTLIDSKQITLTDAQRKALFGENAGGNDGSNGGDGDSSNDDANNGGQHAGDKERGNDDLRPARKSAAPSGQVVTCTTETIPATAGTPNLSWGVKSSFTNYIEGGIAKGSISTSNGAVRGGGTFSWGSGSGSLNASGLGTLSFPGVVHFTGHGDILNTTISGVRIKITGANSGVLIANVKSQDMEGNDASASNVTFANLSFSSVSATGGTASATLTAAGAKAFAGFYNAGESLDRVTVSMSGATAERTVEVCYDADGNRVNPDGTAYTGPDDGLAHTGLGHSTDLLGLVAGLTLAGAVLLVARARRTGRVGPTRR